MKDFNTIFEVVRNLFYVIFVSASKMAEYINRCEGEEKHEQSKKLYESIL